MPRWFHALVAVVVAAVGSFATSAYAQDYTVTTVSSQMITPPANATVVTGLTDDSNTGAITMPFTVPFFGTFHNTFYLHSNGYIQLGPTTAPGAGSTFSNAVPLTLEGQVAPMWDDLNPAVAPPTGTTLICHFATGTAPNRIYVVHWGNIMHFSTGGPYTFQLQLHESTGRIVFAYDRSAATWASATYSSGIKAPSPDTRVVMATPTNDQTVIPANDFQFEPKQTLITGTVLMDQVVADQTGYGNSVLANQPAAGLGAELRDSTGNKKYAEGTCDQNGLCTIIGLALDTSKTGGTIWLTTSSQACRVSDSTPTTYKASPATQFLTGFNNNQTTFSTITITESNDQNAVFRRKAQIAQAIGLVWGHAKQRNTAQIPTLEVYYDDAASAELTNYVNGGSTGPTYLRIGGANSANMDAFDAPVIMRAYARHVVRALWGLTTTSTSLNLDQQIDLASGLADGLALYVYAATYGKSVAYDATSTAAATAFDLEAPSLTQPKGDTVGGWWAAAFYDTIDGANEPHDTLDGTSGNDRWRLADELLPLTSFAMKDVLDRWDTKGYPTGALVIDLVHHRVLADDAVESDDTLATANYVGNAGFRLPARTLNPYNHDWYRMTLPKATDQLFADMVFARAQTTAQVRLEITNEAGIVLASGVWDDSVGAMRAVASNCAAGVYLVHVAHEGGGFLGGYDFQVFARLVVDIGNAKEWTLTKTYNGPAVVDGGVPPYATNVKTGTSLPPGMSFDPATARIYGNPQQVGTTSFTLITSDSAQPQNRFTLNLDFKVNDQVSFAAPALTGIAVGKAADVNLGRVGGTNPITVSDQTGGLPEGLALDANFHITGSTSALGGYKFGFKATDLAGSTSTMTTTVVACAPYTKAKMPVDLGAADAAAGFYFDAIQGSTATITLATGKGKTRRALGLVVVGPDGTAVQGGKSKIKLGSVSLSALPLTLSGRYFVLFSGADTLAATQMLATLKTTLPTKGAGAATLDFNKGTGGSFGALNGASLTITGTTTGGMGLRIGYLKRPDGTNVALDQVTTKVVKNKTTFTVKLDQSGTWTFEIRPTPGNVGDVKYTLAIKQPKGVIYSAD